MVTQSVPEKILVNSFTWDSSLIAKFYFKKKKKAKGGQNRKICEENDEISFRPIKWKNKNWCVN